MKTNSIPRLLSHSIDLPTTKSHFPSIETLENRIAPAALVGNVLHYTDIDGDLVTVTFSKAGVVGTAFHFNADGVDGNATEPQQLQVIDLSNNTTLDGTNITVAVKRSGHGDGQAAIGYIGAVGVDLGKVSIAGDLSQIDANGIVALSTTSIGLYHYAAQGASDLHSSIAGSFGSLTVKGDVKDAYFDVQGGLGSLTIGGSLIGGSDDNSGSIQCVDFIGNVKIGGSLAGGAGKDSGYIYSPGAIGNVTIGGSVVGGGDKLSGSIFGVGMGKVKIGGDLLGGVGTSSGFIGSAGGMGSVTVGGSVVGGSTASETGEIVSAGDMGAVSIAHDLIGGSATGSTSLNESGIIGSVSGRIASVAVGGSVVTGANDGSGTFTLDGAIVAGADIGGITVKGSLIGHGAESPVVITAVGQATPTLTTDSAIGKITIGGSVEWAQILGGYSTTLQPVNADAQIGAVKVGGSWIASDLVAGAMNSGYPNFGDVNDVKISGANTTNAPGIVSKIASITIGGIVVGTDTFAPNNSADHFGFAAQSIGSFKVNGVSFVLQNSGTLQLSHITGDVGLSIIAI